jgi:hypothetical protein
LNLDGPGCVFSIDAEIPDLVHSLCDVLAAGAGSARALSNRLAVVAAVQNRGDRGWVRAGPGLGAGSAARKNYGKSSLGTERDKEKVKTFFEEIKVLGNELVDKVKALIHEGNVRRIIIKDEHGHTFVEIPVTVAAVGAVFAPILAAVGTLAAMAAKFTIVVEKSGEPEVPA